MFDYLNNFLLNGKNVFITGGCGLIGSEISKAVASVKGRPIIIDIDKSKGQDLANEIINDGLDCSFEYFDTSIFKEFKFNLNKFYDKYGAIDVWINAAYPKSSGWNDKVECVNIDCWKTDVDRHLNSYSWLSKEVGLVMKKQGFGSVINFASIYGIQAPDFSLYESTDMTCPMAYSAIKGGIINLTRYLASYFGPHQVRFNSISPGGIYNNQDPTFVKRYEQKTPLQRMGSVKDIASTSLFLSSDLSSYITGQNILVDGGFSII